MRIPQHIDNLIKEFQEQCEDRGHAWGTHPFRLGTDYCKACGVERKRDEIMEKDVIRSLH